MTGRAHCQRQVALKLFLLHNSRCMVFVWCHIAEQQYLNEHKDEYHFLTMGIVIVDTSLYLVSESYSKTFIMTGPQPPLPDF